MKKAMKVEESFTVIYDFLGENANGRSINSFDTLEKARKDWEDNLKNRKKNDGYDEYWNAKPCIIQHQVVITSFIRE